MPKTRHVEDQIVLPPPILAEHFGRAVELTAVHLDDDPCEFVDDVAHIVADPMA